MAKGRAPVDTSRPELMMTATVYDAHEHRQSGDAHLRPVAEDDLAALGILDKEVV